MILEDDGSECIGLDESGMMIDEIDADAKRAREGVEREAAVRLEELVVREDAHLADVVSGVGGKEAGGDKVVLLEFGWAIH